MDITFMDSKNRKTSKLHRIFLNFSDKINYKRSDKYVALWNLKLKKKSYKSNKI